MDSDSDPGSALEKNGSGSKLFLKDLLNFFNKAEFSNFLFFAYYTWWIIQKSGNFYLVAVFGWLFANGICIFLPMGSAYFCGSGSGKPKTCGSGS